MGVKSPMRWQEKVVEESTKSIIVKIENGEATSGDLTTRADGHFG